uniref:Uncharacterized protein n=1 Tax=Oryza sativa subsp. japonica TaxID=39947 RepID=Q6YTP7_ORYSJ|nr:hypothetical protein [Oryza sativa Japonica Group]
MPLGALSPPPNLFPHPPQVLPAAVRRFPFAERRRAAVPPSSRGAPTPSSPAFPRPSSPPSVSTPPLFPLSPLGRPPPVLARAVPPPPVAAQPVCRRRFGPCRRRRQPCVRAGQAAPLGRPQPSDRLRPIWAVHVVDAHPRPRVDHVHRAPSPFDSLTCGARVSAPAAPLLTSARVFPRFACQRVESVVSEDRGREEKSSEDPSEEARQVTHSP